MKLFRIALFATLLSVGIASCGGSKDDPINNVTPTPTPSNTTVKVESVAVSSATVSLTEGDSQTITVTISPSNATDKKYTFSSSDTSIVTIDENGKITAVKAGEATITVTTSDGNKTATCKVTVKVKEIPVESVSLDKTELSLTEEQTETLTATVYPDNATNTEVTWTSSDPSIATVDKDGKITALKAGEATITVTTMTGNKSAVCKVVVNASNKRIKEIKYNSSNGELKLTYRYDYDSENRVVKITQEERYWSHYSRKYEDSKTIIPYSYTDESVIVRNTSLSLVNGLIKDGCTYDDNNRLIKYKNGNNTVSWEWVDGNPSINPIRPNHHIEYSDIKIPHNFIFPEDIYDYFWFTPLAMAGYYGKLPENLPSVDHYRWKLSDGHDVHTINNFSWVFNNGYLTKVEVKQINESDVSNYNDTETREYSITWE